MTILITGGAGFIGCNLAAALLRSGERVTIVDNLSRPRTDQNLAWLQTQFGDKLRFERADIRDQAAMDSSSPATTPSSTWPARSPSPPRWQTRARISRSTRWARSTCWRPRATRATPPIVIYASTNKVYGGMEDVRRSSRSRRATPTPTCPTASPETQPLDFHSPYGCSKGAGDQYVRDYARIYGLRRSCSARSAIYGPRQFGVEDQGWLAHFVIAAQAGPADRDLWRRQASARYAVYRRPGARLH